MSDSSHVAVPLGTGSLTITAAWQAAASAGQTILSLPSGEGQKLARKHCRPPHLHTKSSIRLESGY